VTGPNIIAHLSVALLGVSTPEQLTGWPIALWVLLDRTDQQRRRQLEPDDRLGDLRDDIDTRDCRALSMQLLTRQRKCLLERARRCERLDLQIRRQCRAYQRPGLLTAGLPRSSVILSARFAC
jgi:hypothetical protein